MLRPAWLALIFLPIAAFECAAIITSDDAGTHRVTPGEFSYGLNLDGVALIAGDVPESTALDQLIPLCTGALISDWHLISAAHCYDEDNDARPDSVFTSFPHVAAFELADRVELLRIHTQLTSIPPEYLTLPADLAVLTLEVEAPADVPRYPLSTIASALETVVVTGYGATGSGSEGTIAGFDSRPTKRAGLNRYEALRDGPPYPGVEMLVYDFDSGAADHNTLDGIGFKSDLGFGANEVYAARGDSGGPVFRLDGSIVGISAFGGRLDDAPEESFGAVAFDVPVASFQDFITTATSGQVVFVPEPKSSSLWSVLFVGWLLRLRNRRQAFWTS